MLEFERSQSDGGLGNSSLNLNDSIYETRVGQRPLLKSWNKNKFLAFTKVKSVVKAGRGSVSVIFSQCEKSE